MVRRNWLRRGGGADAAAFVLAGITLVLCVACDHVDWLLLGWPRPRY